MFGIPIDVITLLLSGLGGFIMKSMAIKREMEQLRFTNTLKALAVNTENSIKSSDSANNRIDDSFGKWTRRIIALSIMSAVIGLCYIAGFHTSSSFVETTKEGWSFLFGLVGTPDKTEFIEVNGFIHMKALWLFAGHVVSFYIGSGAAKAR
jgi:hypothetical protein